MHPLSKIATMIVLLASYSASVLHLSSRKKKRVLVYSIIYYPHIYTPGVIVTQSGPKISESFAMTTVKLLHYRTTERPEQLCMGYVGQINFPLHTINFRYTFTTQHAQ